MADRDACPHGGYPCSICEEEHRLAAKAERMETEIRRLTAALAEAVSTLADARRALEEMTKKRDEKAKEGGQFGIALVRIANGVCDRNRTGPLDCYETEAAFVNATTWICGTCIARAALRAAAARDEGGI